MNRKLQVFVSSTYLDMRAERQAAVEVILQAGHIPAGMELFAAGDEAQWEIIRRWIDESDVFMLILGGRYGSIEPKSGKSYIEREYDYAVKQDKRFFAAVQSEEAIEAKVKTDGSKVREQDNPKELRAFRERVLTKMSGRFDTTDQLQLVALRSLANFSADSSLTGWVRASEQAIPKSVFDELERLRAEVAELKSQSDDQSRRSTLSMDARLLLRFAKGNRGTIRYQKLAGDYGIAVGGHRFGTLENPEELARWEAALEELVQAGFIRDDYGSDETFDMKHAGYQFLMDNP